MCLEKVNAYSARMIKPKPPLLVVSTRRVEDKQPHHTRRLILIKKLLHFKPCLSVLLSSIGII